MEGDVAASVEDVTAGTASAQAHLAFVAGAGRGSLVAATLLATNWLLVAVVVRTPQSAGGAEPALIDWAPQ